MKTPIGRHYQGTQGAEYFNWQRSVGEIGGKLNSRKFRDFVHSTDTVVDFGCGSGALLTNLSCATKVGIEPNPHARQEARSRGIECVESPSEIADGFADVIVSNHALEHALNPFAELCELHRIMKPGGRTIIYVPLDDYRSQPEPADDLNHHVYTWTPLLLRNLVSEAGFDVLESNLVTHAWPPKTALLMRLPEPVFDALARVWSVVSRRRQVMLVAA